MKAIAAGLGVLAAATVATSASAQINAAVQVGGRVAGSCRAVQTASEMVLRCSTPVVRAESLKLSERTKIVTVAPAV